MDRLLTGKSMKMVDSYTIENIGIPSMVLMERAAFGVLRFIKENMQKDRKFLCLCGTGNNGADGIALARMLKIEGYEGKVFVVGDENKATDQWKQQKDIAVKCGVVIENIMDSRLSRVSEESDEAYNRYWVQELEQYDYIVDCIFGIGLTREVGGQFAKIINALNTCKRSNNVYVAADIPSGLNADTGRIMGCAIKADYTITFGEMKSGLLLYEGKDVAGKVIVENIGFPEASLESVGEKFYAINKMDVRKVCKRLNHTNKGSYGKVTVVAGSKDIYGAVHLAAMAAIHTGCGMVKVITHENNRNLIYEKIPEAMVETYSQVDKYDVSAVENVVKWSDVVVIGPGLGTDENARELLQSFMSYTKQLNKAIVIDADALNLIAKYPQLKKNYHKKTVITPHMMEASRLLNIPVKEIAENIVQYGCQYATENGITVVMKDSTTVILGIESFDNKCNNRVCVNTTGNAGMATAGSGDVLSGIIGAVLAGSLDVSRIMKGYGDNDYEKCFISAALGVFIHGMAGDVAKEFWGEVSMTSGEMMKNISVALRKCQKDEDR